MQFYIYLCVIALTAVRVHYCGRILNGLEAYPDSSFTFRLLSVEDGETLLANVTTGAAISEYFGIIAAQAVHGYVLVIEDYILNFHYWYIGFDSIHINEQKIQAINPNNIQSHPGYDPTTLIHNIAVIKFTNPVNNYIPRALERPEPSMIFVFGFGFSQSTTEPTDTLQTLPALILNVCSTSYPDFDKENSFCAIIPLDSMFAGGDQGGPVTNIERNILYGIASYWGELVNDPAVIINIASYNNFINQVIETLS